MINGLKFIVLLFVGWFALPNESLKSVSPPELKINQIQILGSHNSYRLHTYQPIWNYLKRLRHPVSRALIVKPWDYSHNTPLDSQLSVYGLRSLELDIYHDPQGGRFHSRLGNRLVNEPAESGIEDLKKPGFKIMHVPDFDYETHHVLFTDALKKIKVWSDQNPGHLPLYVMVEMKELHFMKYLFPRHCTKVLKFTKNAVDSIDMEIESVFGKNSEQIITPDEIRGNYANLQEAVLDDQWPTITNATGKIFFILQGSTEAKANYLKDHYSLKNRTMFLFSSEGKPEAAFILMDNPKKTKAEIKRMVKKGYMIRTRSDANTKQARKGNYNRYDDAFESGAQIISTDYYKPDKRFTKTKNGTDFKIQMPDGEIARKNPVNTSDTLVWLIPKKY